jgi:hypothetical protein
MSEQNEEHLRSHEMTSYPHIGWSVQKSSRPYQPKFARWTEKFRLIGAQLSELEDFFAVDARTLDDWTREQPEFARALKTQPTALGVSSEDIGLFSWLKDHRRGDLGI